VKKFLLSVMILLIIALIVAGCSKSTPGSTVPTASVPASAAPTPSASAPAKVVELRFASILPPFSDQGKLIQEWIKMVEQATDGEVKITLYGAQELMSQTDQLSGIRAGLADMCDIMYQDFPEQFPLHGIMALPFIPVGDARTATKVGLELVNKFPEMQAESKDWKVLFNGASPGPQLNTQKEVHVPDDLKGVKISTSDVLAPMFKDMGAVPILLSMPDMMSSLERGLVTSNTLQWDALVDLGLYSKLPYHIVFPTSPDIGVEIGYAETVMTHSAWDKLSPKAKKVFENDLPTWIYDRWYKMWDNSRDRAIAAFKEKGGHTFIQVTPEQEKLWLDYATKLNQKYIANVDAKGLLGTAVYNEMMRLLADNKK
jgi:TRAP-type transport system periplasmic protein